MSEYSKLLRQRLPPLSQSNADTPLILADQQCQQEAPSHESPATPEPNSGGKGRTRHRRSSLFGAPSIPQALSPSTAPRPVVVPPKSPLFSAFAAPAAAAPFLPSTPKRAFARSLPCSSNGASPMQAREGKLLEGQESLVRAKSLLVPLQNARSMSWQAEDKLTPSTFLLPRLQSAPRAGRTSSGECMSTMSDNGSTRPHCFLPPEVIRTSGANGPMAPNLPQYGSKSAPHSTVGKAPLSSTHIGSCSAVSDDGSVPLHPTPPKQQPCAFRWKTIDAPIHNMRQPLHKGSSPSQDRLSDSGTEGVEICHHDQQQPLQPGPHLSDATSLSGAQSLSPQASSVCLGGGSFKRRSSGIPKQVTIALEYELGCAEASMALHKDARGRSMGEELSRAGTPTAGLQRQADGEGRCLVGRSRWSCMGLLKTEDTPLSRELLACEREKRLRLKASESCEQLARANARANPSAFCAAAVEKEEAKRGLAAEAAQLSLKKLEGQPSNDLQAVDNFHTCVRLLRASRSFYHAPEAEKQKMTRASLVPKGPWTLEHSLFQRRALENDACDIFDTPGALEAQFEQDWQRICQRGGLVCAIAVAAVAAVAPSAQHEEAIDTHPEVVLQLEEVHHKLRNHIQLIRSCFIFFAALSPTHRSHELMAMRMEDFCKFARCCNSSDLRSPFCEPSSTEAIFKACKSPAGPSGVQQGALQESAATHPLLLDRSEFLECIVRLAMAKQMRATLDVNGRPNVANAVGRLLEEDLEPNLSPSAKVDANTFREDRLYSEEMEMCIRSHWALLTKAFKVYSAGGDVLGIEGWLALLAGGALLGQASHTGIDKHAAKVVFMISQASVADKLGSPQSRDEGLKFFDFVEALARLSEVFCPPTFHELCALFQSRPSSSHTPLSAEASEHLWTALMDEQSRGSSQSRPISTTSVADTEAISTMPPLFDEFSEPGVASKAGGAEASAPPQSNGQPKSAAGIERSPVTPLQNGGGNNSNDNMSSSSKNGSSSSNHGYSCVHIFFKDMLQWQQLCKHRIRGAGLDNVLHTAARQRPLLDSFEPMMELFESGMRRTWGGRSQADTFAKMEASMGLCG